MKALKELHEFMQSDKFVREYGENLYINLKRINQDFVESFFSCQRQMCGGTQNMTAYVYGYNINNLTSLRSSRLLMKKQTNIYEIQESLPYINEDKSLPKRKANESIWDSVPWFVTI